MFDDLSSWDRGQAIYLFILLVVVLAGSSMLRGIGLGRSLKMLLAWTAIFAGIFVLAVYREDARALFDDVSGRAVAEFDPASGATVAEGYRIRARPDGHFWVRAQVNDQPVLFLIDTGASDVVLSAATARRVGIDPAALRYDRVAVTASGTVRSASTTADSIEIGPIVRTGVPVAVTQGPLEVNLLGMRYMRTLRGWSVEGNSLILNP